MAEYLDTVKAKLNDYYAKNKVMPSEEWLRAALNCDLADLKKTLTELVDDGFLIVFNNRYQLSRRPRQKVISIDTTPSQEPKQKRKYTRRSREHGNKVLNFLLDFVALIVALVVDLILNCICMLILAPGPLEAIGFVAISIVVVLFSVRSWLKNNKILWAMLALVAFFFDLSFVLVATDAQTQAAQLSTINASADAELLRLTKNADMATATLTDLHAQYSAAMKRDTLIELDRQITEAKAVADQAEALRKARYDFIESGQATIQATRQHTVITAALIFSAIPDAVEKSRTIPLVVFALIFSGLQIVIVTAASDSQKKREEKL